MKNYLIPITDDLFDIAARLRSVKPTYKVYFNKQSQRYEVHDTAQRAGSLAFVVPYENLDARTLDYARFTAVQNARNLFEEVERHNAKVEQNLIQQAARAVSEVEEVL